MTRLAHIICIATFLAPGIAAFAGQIDYNNTEAYLQSASAKRAEQDWVLNCGGCHKLDGTGRPERGLPNLQGKVAKFLHVEGGREYLSRVPGVTNAAISDLELAELINWLLIRFDPEDIPEDFKPYSVGEVAKWRANPLALKAATVRKDLLQKQRQLGK